MTNEVNSLLVGNVFSNENKGECGLKNFHFLQVLRERFGEGLQK